MEKLKHLKEIEFGEFGGAECFLADIDGDGELEILTYQGPSVFGATPYRNLEHISKLLPESTSVSAFKLSGERMWTWGEPNKADFPYVSHSYESCLASGDIDGDGEMEIAVADGSRAVILNGKNGHEKRSTELPDDNFYIIQTAGCSTNSNEAAIVLKNGEGGHDDWLYGEPVIGLNSDLEVVWRPKMAIGGGHHILALDLDGDGKNEYLIGYSAFDLTGNLLWTVDSIDEVSFEPDKQHVDYTSLFIDKSGKLYIGMAGSDKIYLVENGGKTIFAEKNIHCQGTAIGHFRNDSEFQVALYNSPNGPMTLYDPQGCKVWDSPIKRRWPETEGKIKNSRMHRNRPILKLETPQNDLIAYADGGWPWVMDGNGEILQIFEAPENSAKPDCPEWVPESLRRDDIGWSFAVRIEDINGDGRKETLIYDRRFMWIYPAVTNL
jgi:hypothetical protein